MIYSRLVTWTSLTVKWSKFQNPVQIPKPEKRGSKETTEIKSKKTAQAEGVEKRA